MSLEQHLREAARSGRLPALTLWRTNGRYQANLNTGGNSWNVQHADDPVDALLKLFAPPPSAPPAPAGDEDIFA